MPRAAEVDQLVNVTPYTPDELRALAVTTRESVRVGLERGMHPLQGAEPHTLRLLATALSMLAPAEPADPRMKVIEAYLIYTNSRAPSSDPGADFIAFATVSVGGAREPKQEEEYPEHVKLKAVQPQSQSCGSFLEWLQHEKGLVLAEWHTPTWQELGYEHEPRKRIEARLVQAAVNVRGLLGEFFKIDSNKLDEEKQAMFNTLRANTRQGGG